MAGTVPSNVSEIATVLSKLMCFSFQSASLTSLMLALLAEPALASEVVLNLSVTVDIVLPASDVRSNFRKLV